MLYAGDEMLGKELPRSPAFFARQIFYMSATVRWFSYSFGKGPAKGDCHFSVPINPGQVSAENAGYSISTKTVTRFSRCAVVCDHFPTSFFVSETLCKE